MRCCSALFAALTASAVLSAQPRTVDAVKQVKIEEAALLAVDQSISSIRKQERKPEELSAVILGDPSLHSRRDASQKILLEVERKFLQGAVRAQLTAFAATRSDLQAGWVDQMMTGQQERIARTVSSLLDAEFGERFKRARQIAVESQRGSLSLNLAPTPSDVEASAGPYHQFAEFSLDIAQKRAIESASGTLSKYVAVAQAGRAIFEENEAYLRERANEIFSREVTELWQQLHFIVQHAGGGEIEASRIELLIAKGMSGLPSQHRPFPVTKTAIRDHAAELERTLFLGNIKSQLARPCPALPADAVLKSVSGDADRLPRTLNEHVTEVLPGTRAITANNLLTRWTSRIPDPDRTAFRRRLEESIKGPLGSQILTDGVADCVRDALRPFREILAAKELAAKWPSGANLSLALDEGTIRKLYPAPKENEEVLLPAPKLHLEETEKAFSEKRRVLIEEGTRAVQSQMSIADDPERIKTFQTLVRKGRGNDWLKEIEAEYENSVSTEWNARRSTIITNPGKYKDLFQITREEIIKNLKQDVQISEVPSTVGQQGPGGGGTGTGGGKGDGKGPGSGGGTEDNGGGGGGGAGVCGVQGDQANWPLRLFVFLALISAGMAGYFGGKYHARTTAARA